MKLPLTQTHLSWIHLDEISLFSSPVDEAPTLCKELEKYKDIENAAQDQ